MSDFEFVRPTPAGEHIHPVDQFRHDVARIAVIRALNPSLLFYGTLKLGDGLLAEAAITDLNPYLGPGHEGTFAPLLELRVKHPPNNAIIEGFATTALDDVMIFHTIEGRTSDITSVDQDTIDHLFRSFRVRYDTGRRTNAE
ncbi:MAG: hypothetical protein ABIP50_02670 [Candidatus Saccharimonadales bacterium]